MSRHSADWGRCRRFGAAGPALLACGAAFAACGTSDEQARPPPPAARHHQATFKVSSEPCDDAMRRALETKVGNDLKRAPRDEDGIVYSETNSGCAMLSTPLGPRSRP
jgi:hypothetical protein